jgi:hypothetical protein
MTDEVQVLNAPSEETKVSTEETKVSTQETKVSTEEKQTPETTTPPSPEQKLVNVAVTDQNVALNLMVSFLSLANKRGSFTLDESAKIWECVKLFQNPNTPPPVPN